MDSEISTKSACVDGAALIEPRPKSLDVRAEEFDAVWSVVSYSDQMSIRALPSSSSKQRVAARTSGCFGSGYHTTIHFHDVHNRSLSIGKHVVSITCQRISYVVILVDFECPNDRHVPGVDNFP